MRDLLIDLVNHRTFITLSIVAIMVAGILLGRDGIQVSDAIIILLVAVGSYGVWRLLLTRATQHIDSLNAYQNALRNSQHPTLVQFYSPYCAGCMAVKPLVDQLELEAGNRLQIIRLNIDQEPGKSLMGQYGVIFTPTFIYFDRKGVKVRDSVFVLDSARILYDLERPG